MPDLKPAACICVDYCPEDENPCPHCRAIDPYDPCPVVGFGCGTDCDDDEHCTPEQQKAADGLAAPNPVDRVIAARAARPPVKLPDRGELAFELFHADNWRRDRNSNLKDWTDPATKREYAFTLADAAIAEFRRLNP